MDQSEYDSTNQEFKNFLAANNLNIETKDDLSCDLELKNRLLLKHIVSIPLIIPEGITGIIVLFFVIKYLHLNLESMT